MQKVFLVSYNGLANSGGVEKVCNYLNEIINDDLRRIIIVDKDLIKKSWYGGIYKSIFGKIHIISFTLMSSLYIMLNRRKGDIKIAHGFNSPFFKTDYLFVHGTMQGYINKVGQKINFASKILIWLEKKAVKNADVILCVSKNAINEVREYYSQQIARYYIVNNGVDDAVFYPIEKNRFDNILSILYCGRLDYGKGVDKILDLAKNIEKTENFRLVIACNNQNNIKLFEGLKNTTIHVGVTVSKMNEFYNSGDILFFPSMYEGFEMVTLESLSAGIPVIGNNVGAISELIRLGEPGVELIDFDNILDQIKRITSEYQTRKDFLHDNYKSKYGLEVYKNKLNDIIA